MWSLITMNTRGPLYSESQALSTYYLSLKFSPLSQTETPGCGFTCHFQCRLSCKLKRRLFLSLNRQSLSVGAHLSLLCFSNNFFTLKTHILDSRVAGFILHLITHSAHKHKKRICFHAAAFS